ncbi:hypothetical protein PC9H_002116 [Pleurotus ostreatus]|uniref:Uncharacterized protein n=1 Tax=Pleurotus ostreatus TaxID=5322 RepID=A0A8H7DMC4_PLEOS|nr:uncharacterized protein PC9H_002116 [Pleurotus ostreatus]KAF7419525.1 hypothetical protein PC9H_002116 [Pleurotus ostreatus]
MEECRTPPERSSSLDSFLDVSEVVLTALKDISAVSPVPFLGDAAKLSLVILKTVQAVRKNKALWTGLAVDIARLVAVVAAKLDDTASCNLDSDTLDQIKQLNRVLQGIEDAVRRMVARNIFTRIMGSRGDAAKVQKYRRSLDLAIDIFGVRAALTNAENMQRIRLAQQRLIAGQEGMHSKQDELLLNQRMATALLRKIDTSISTQAGSLASPPPAVMSICPEHATSASPTHSATPSSPLKGFPHVVPEHANITVIAGDKIVNNINSVTHNSHSHRVKTVNTTNSHNTYKTARSGGTGTGQANPSAEGPLSSCRLTGSDVLRPLWFFDFDLLHSGGIVF